MQKYGVVAMKILLKQDGFTLIEALTAMVILTIGILSYFTLQGNMIGANHRAYTMTQATNLVAAQLEAIRQSPYSTLADSTLATQFNDAQTGYSVTWTVTDDTPVSGAKLIAATVVVPNNGPTVTLDYVKYDDGN
jgi:type IV pilus modification protein PilV